MRYWQRIILFMTAWPALDGPRSFGDAIKGSCLDTLWKYRVGDYQIIPSIEDDALQIPVVNIDNRRGVYR